MHPAPFVSFMHALRKQLHVVRLAQGARQWYALCVPQGHAVSRCLLAKSVHVRAICGSTPMRLAAAYLAHGLGGLTDSNMPSRDSITCRTTQHHTSQKTQVLHPLGIPASRRRRRLREQSTGKVHGQQHAFSKVSCHLGRQLASLSCFQHSWGAAWAPAFDITRNARAIGQGSGQAPAVHPQACRLCACASGRLQAPCGPRPTYCTTVSFLKSPLGLPGVA